MLRVSEAHSTVPDDEERKALIHASVPRFSNQPYLLSTGVIPDTDDFPGYAQFAALLGGVASNRNKWAYCAELNKLYTVWHQVVPIDFRWNHERTEPDVVVRALPIFSDRHSLHDPVIRCFIHMDPSDPANEDFRALKHILRSENPGAFYEENLYSKRCSVVVPLGNPQPGTGTVTVTYKFMCKTSCVSGSNRRPMAVIFTLERTDGQVLGRQTMAVKVCSCPRRDMEKEQHVFRRRIKNERFGESEYELQISLPDIEMFKKLLEFNHGGVTSLLRTTPLSDPRFTELSDFLTLLEEKLTYLQSL